MTCRKPGGIASLAIGGVERKRCMCYGLVLKRKIKLSAYSSSAKLKTIRLNKHLNESGFEQINI